MKRKPYKYQVWDCAKRCWSGKLYQRRYAAECYQRKLIDEAGMEYGMIARSSFPVHEIKNA